MYEYRFDYEKPKYRDKAKIRHTDSMRFIVHVKFEDVYVNPTGYVEKRCETSNYDVEILLLIGKNK